MFQYFTGICVYIYICVNIYIHAEDMIYIYTEDMLHKQIYIYIDTLHINFVHMCIRTHYICFLVYIIV